MDLKAGVIEILLKASRDAKVKAYSRYSKFPVGAALLCHDGTIIAALYCAQSYIAKAKYNTEHVLMACKNGCSVDNASIGLSICAERTAVVKAVSEGYQKFIACAISSDMKNAFITPCGACRQFLIEFGTDLDIYMTKPDLSYEKRIIEELMPSSFLPNALDSERISKSS